VYEAEASDLVGRLQSFIAVGDAGPAMNYSYILGGANFENQLQLRLLVLG